MTEQTCLQSGVVAFEASTTRVKIARIWFRMLSETPPAATRVGIFPSLSFRPSSIELLFPAPFYRGSSPRPHTFFTAFRRAATNSAHAKACHFHMGHTVAFAMALIMKPLHFKPTCNFSSSEPCAQRTFRPYAKL